MREHNVHFSKEGMSSEDEKNFKKQTSEPSEPSQPSETPVNLSRFVAPGQGIALSSVGPGFVQPGGSHECDPYNSA
jgi:hypothetical protein